MAKGSTSMPAAPDPLATAQAQGQINRGTVQDSARLNAVDTYGPWGQTTYQFGNRGDLSNVPVAQRTTLTPQGQQAFDTQQRITGDLTGRAWNALQSAPQSSFSTAGINYDPRNYDTSALPMYRATSYGRGSSLPGQQVSGPLPGQQPGSGGVWNLPGSQSPGGDALPYDPRSYNVQDIDGRAADAAYGYAMNKLQPDFAMQQQRLESQLSNRGIPVGSRAWQNATSSLDRTQNSSRENAANQAYLMGHQVGGDWISREQGLRNTAVTEGLNTHRQSQADFTGRLQIEQQLRNSAIQEAERNRMWAINDASIYLQGAPAMQMPNAPQVPTYQIAAPDYQGATYQSYTAQAQQAQQARASQAAALGNLAQLGGTAMGLWARPW